MNLKGKIIAAPFTGLLDISIAYNSLTIFYDPVIVFNLAGSSPNIFLTGWLQSMANAHDDAEAGVQGTNHIIPVCYEPPFSTDLEAVAAFHNLPKDEIVRLHLQSSYYVFMVGFSPGFPYLGIVCEQLETPRKASPTLQVAPGSVGIAGKQTGIYPCASPGGWNIIGRTPLRIFDINEKELCLFKTGDTVSFSEIDKQTFNYLNQYADT